MFWGFLSSVLAFSSIIIMLFTVDLFELIHPEILGESWKCRFVSFSKFGKDFGHYFFQKLFSFSPLILRASLTYVEMDDSVLNSVYFSSLFSFCSFHWKISNELYSSLLILSPAQMCHWIPQINFSFELLFFSTQDFLFGFFFILPIYLMRHHIHGFLPFFYLFFSLRMF